MKRYLLLPLFLSCFVASAEEKPICRRVAGYQLRYASRDKLNPANNDLWLEDSKGFRILQMRGADCSQVALLSDRVYWLEYPSHQISGYNMTSRLYENFSEGNQFVVSPDGQTMVVERTEQLVIVNLATKNETSFCDIPSLSLPGDQNKAILFGWTPNNENFWFAWNGGAGKPLDYQVLTRKGLHIQTNMRADPLLESVFNFDKGWMTQNNGTKLSVFDLIEEKKVELWRFPVGTRVRPHWGGGGGLKYTKEGQEIVVSGKDLSEWLQASSSNASTISKKSFVPVHW